MDCIASDRLENFINLFMVEKFYFRDLTLPAEGKPGVPQSYFHFQNSNLFYIHFQILHTKSCKCVGQAAEPLKFFIKQMCDVSTPR